MNKKATINWVITTSIILMFFLIQKDVVWGGTNNQTIPTPPPSWTPTSASTAIQVKPSSTNISQPILQPTITNTISPTATQKTVTETAQEPTESKPVDATNTPVEGIDATSSISLPLVSMNDEIEHTGEDSSQSGSIKTVPSFIIPLAVILLLVFVYLIFRFSRKKLN